MDNYAIENKLLLLLLNMLFSCVEPQQHERSCVGSVSAYTPPTFQVLFHSFEMMAQGLLCTSGRNLLPAAMQQAMISVPPTSAQTAPVPSFQNYEIGLEKWGAYMQRLNQHMIAHAVGVQHKKKAYFLSWVGANTYELIDKLFSASELDAPSFARMANTTCLSRGPASNFFS